MKARNGLFYCEYMPNFIGKVDYGSATDFTHHIGKSTLRH